MWYFSWVLGLGLACCFAILNAMWFELQQDSGQRSAPVPPAPPAEGRDVSYRVSDHGDAAPRSSTATPREG